MHSLGQEIIQDTRIKVSRRSVFCYELWLNLCETQGVTPAFALRLGISIHLNIGLRYRLRFRVIGIFRRLNLCAIRFQQRFIALHFGMEAFSMRFCPSSLSAHRRNKAALLSGLEAIGTGIPSVTPDLALSTGQTRIAFHVIVECNMRSYRGLGHVWNGQGGNRGE